MANTHPTVIFISGRFRSGTTLLWHMFDVLPAYCAWYEPLHPNLPEHVHHVQPKADHRGVKDYWGSYRAQPEALDTHSRALGHTDLLLHASDDAPALKRHIDHLIQLSAPRVPVLQFNRVDFRLGWLRQQYPEALIITVQRDVVQNWLSCRRHMPPEWRDDESHPDAYELMQWSQALSCDLPFLRPLPGRHGFFRHCALQRLSALMAAAHSDLPIELERDVFKSTRVVKKLGSRLGWGSSERAQVAALIRAAAAHEISAAERKTLKAIEQEVDAWLDDLGLSRYFAHAMLKQIRLDHAAAWRRAEQAHPFTHSAQELLRTVYAQNAQITELLAQVPAQPGDASTG